MRNRYLMNMIAAGVGASLALQRGATKGHGRLQAARDALASPGFRLDRARSKAVWKGKGATPLPGFENGAYEPRAFRGSRYAIQQGNGRRKMPNGRQEMARRRRQIAAGRLRATGDLDGRAL